MSSREHEADSKASQRSSSFRTSKAAVSQYYNLSTVPNPEASATVYGRILHFISIPLSPLQTLHLARVLLFAYPTTDPETKLPVIRAGRISEVDFIQVKDIDAPVIFADHPTEGRDHALVLHLKNS